MEMQTAGASHKINSRGTGRVATTTSHPIQVQPAMGDRSRPFRLSGEMSRAERSADRGDTRSAVKSPVPRSGHCGTVRALGRLPATSAPIAGSKRQCLRGARSKSSNPRPSAPISAWEDGGAATIPTAFTRCFLPRIAAGCRGTLLGTQTKKSALRIRSLVQISDVRWGEGRALTAPPSRSVVPSEPPSRLPAPI